MASEASEWEDREREERPAFLRVEETLWAEDWAGYRFLSVVLYFFWVFHSSFFCHTCEREASS